MAWPSNRTSPPWKVSSRLMQRSNVVLPEPDGPITATTSPGNTSSDTSRKNGVAPNCLNSPRIETIRVTAALVTASLVTASLGIRQPSFQRPAAQRQAVTNNEIDGRDAAEYLERRQRA